MSFLLDAHIGLFLLACLFEYAAANSNSTIKDVWIYGCEEACREFAPL